MTKTMKKILLVVILFVTILLLKSTNVFAVESYVSLQEKAFDSFTKLKDGEVYDLYLGEKMYVLPSNILGYLSQILNVSVNDSKVVTIENRNELKAVKVGKTDFSVTVEYNGTTVTKNFKINVKEHNKVDTKLESKINDVNQITQNTDAKNLILLANGELWKTKDKTFTMSKKETGNVAKYVYSNVYRSTYPQDPKVEAILKNDGKLTIKNSKTKAKTVSNVKDILSFGYLTEKGEYYFYELDENGKLKTKKTITGIKEVLSDYVVTKKGKTYAISGKKLADFEAVQTNNWSSCGSGLLLDKKGTLYYYKYDYGYDYKDGKYQKVRKEQYILEKIDKNVKNILERRKIRN